MPKTWLVTGALRGLGRRITEAALEAGDSVLATARNTASAEDLVGRYGARIGLFDLDVTDPLAALAAVDAAVSAFGRLDVVVNNAGYGDIGSIEDTPLSSIRAQIETNLFGVINVTKAAIPVLRRQGGGHFLQFSSVGGRIGAMGRAAYSAAKFGVEGFSEVLAKEMAPLGVRVTIVEPGGFRTDFAGASTTLDAGRPEYDATVGAAARFQREYDGRQPGDPAKAARVILDLVAMEDPPLRLLLGSDAVRAVMDNDRAKAASDARWRELSISTDFGPPA